MIRRPPISTRTDTLFPYPTLFRSPVLVVPSLINRAYVLDLTAERSLLRWLAAHGLRPLLLDWGRPGAEERDFTLTDYIAGRLERALDALRAEEAAPPVLLGYCMGGLLALGLARSEEHTSELQSLMRSSY